MRTINLGSIGLAAVSVACAGATGPSDGEQSTELPAVRVERGARYVPLRRNHPEDFVFKVPEGEGTFEEQETDLESLTDDELAKRMVGLTELDGWVYRVEPQIELDERRQPLGQERPVDRDVLAADHHRVVDRRERVAGGVAEPAAEPPAKRVGS